MKNLTALIISILSFTFVFSAENNKGSENSYTKTSMHLNASLEVKQINLSVLDQDDAFGYLLASTKPSNNWLFIYHDRWGITDIVKDEAYTLWKDLGNVNVLIVDLNDGVIPSNRSEAMRLLVENDVERDFSIIESAINFAGDNAKIGSLGWSNGGSWSIQTAIKAKEKDVACVVYYGMPETNESKLSHLNTDVLAIYGSHDTYVTPTIAKSFKTKMTLAGKTVTELTYEGKGNFADRNSVKYNYEQASNAYNKVLTYLTSKFN